MLTYPEHSAQCPPVDPRSTTPLECRRCDRVRRYGPYWIGGPALVACGTCGCEDVETSDDPRFAGYAGYHSRLNALHHACSGEYLAHGRPTAARSTDPGWMPVAHVRPGDIICLHSAYHEWYEPTMVVTVEDHEVAPGAPRIHLRWLSDEPGHAGGVWGMSAPPGTPILLVQAAIGEPPAPHVNVHYSNAISSRSRGYSRCYRTREEAEADIQEFWPYNNTRSVTSDCWKPNCLR